MVKRDNTSPCTGSLSVVRARGSLLLTLQGVHFLTLPAQARGSESLGDLPKVMQLETAELGSELGSPAAKSKF